MNKNSGNHFPLLPLKHMDSAQLSFELLSQVQRFNRDGREMVTSAAQLATHLHRGQTRRQRSNLPRVPYIEHPLRVAIRIMRWGNPSPKTVTSALLHDTAEDCASRIAELSGMNEEAQSHLAPEQLQHHALQFISESYGRTVGLAVAAVTRAPRALGPYLDDIRQIILTGSYTAKLVKASDLVDNAGSLQHQFGHVPDQMVAKLVAKYMPAVILLAAELERIDAQEGPMPSEYPIAQAAARLRSIEPGLARLVKELHIHFEHPNPPEAS